MALSLVNFHRRVLNDAPSDVPVATTPQLDIAEPEVIDDIDCLFRVLDIPDRARDTRIAWLGQFLKWRQQCTYNPYEIGYLSQAEQSFQIMLINGDDVKRIVSIVKQIRETLPSKIVIPVMSACSDTDCTYLLNHGADDVLHAAMPVVEARARLSAISRRLQWRAFSSPVVEQDAATKRAKRVRNITIARLTPLEERVLGALLENMGQLTTYRQIFAQIAGISESPTSRGIHVVITHLRKKVVRGVTIDNHRGQGFTLKINTLYAVQPEPGNA